MKKLKPKGLKRYSPEVLERLPYWVRELLKMIGEAETSKSRRSRLKKPAPSLTQVASKCS